MNATPAAAIVVLLLRIAAAPEFTLVAGGVVAFLVVWGTLFPFQRQILRTLRDTTPRFPTPQQPS